MFFDSNESKNVDFFESNAVISGDDVSINYFTIISDIPVLSCSEELKLFKDLENGDMSAKEKIVQSNLKLVSYIAKKYSDYSEHGLSLLDLIQEGNIALLKAIDGFDYKKGYKFSTYAVPWIKQFIFRAICKQSRTVRNSIMMCENINKVFSASSKLAYEKGYEPSVDEIALEIGMSNDLVLDCFKNAQEIISLDADEYKEEGALKELLVDYNAEAFEDTVMDNIIIDSIDLLFSVLRPMEQKVLMLRYGFVDDKLWKFSEIGNEVGLSGERVRQIHILALKKIRSSTLVNNFENSFDKSYSNNVGVRARNF